MDKSETPSLHGWNQPPGFGGQPPGFGGPPAGFGGPPQGYGGFPGLGDPFAGPPGFVNPTVIPPGQAAGGGTGKGFGLAELKSMIDRMGGIDGVIGTMTKLQRFVGIMSQMAPLIRVLLGKGAKAAAVSTGTPVTRRRRPSSSAKRKPSASVRARRSGSR